MGRLTLYFLSQLGKAAGFATLVLVLVGCSLYSQRYLGDIIEHGLPLTVFGQLVVFMVPTMLVIMLPITLAGSVLFIYGKLTEDSEVTVAKACGVSQLKLAVPALIAALVGTAISYTMAFTMIPQSIQVFRDVRQELRNTRVDTLLQAGVFNEVVPGLTIYFAEHSDDGVLSHILIHDQRSDQRPTTVVAARAVLAQTLDALTVQLQDGLIQRQAPGEQELSTINFDAYTFDVDLDDLISSGSMNDIAVQELPTEELLWPPPEIEPGSTDYRERLAEGHQRIATPLLCITLTLIATAGAVAGTHQRRFQRKRFLTVGATLGVLVILYHGAVMAARSSTMFIPAFYALMLVPGLCALLVLLNADGRFRGWRSFLGRHVGRPRPA
ncbi:MAG: LptF/LptG family permease [Rhodospirillaceae bacterium]|nr:LptF/LptG family permease [Rhodospirillaceae bacterium]